ncbi:MAG TPA: DUF1707 domain-containing protein [Candidatus Nanopelagicaceae bacterium]|nr:DUF1707 domain-containing protein [Candidatus Nanopelagicaceae bacterium]
MEPKANLPQPSTHPPGARTLASDRDRDLAVDGLSAACGDGRLGLEDFSNRLERALAARTLEELAEIMADLSRPELQVASSRRQGSSWFVSIMGSTVRRGRWLLGASSQAVAVMGECVLDLRQAEVASPDSHILAVTLMGEITVIVPEGIDVDISGIAIMGSKQLRGGDARPLPGSPTIRVTCVAIMGEITVRVKASGTRLGDAEGQPGLEAAGPARWERRLRHRRRRRHVA